MTKSVDLYSFGEVCEALERDYGRLKIYIAVTGKRRKGCTRETVLSRESFL